ncbi:MAG: periplasmic chaperone for outer rane protein Skp [Deltaproteobacteria bacterium]|nr:periplasmic chaperone for outer rane protein Skp [Deltaproteobacteria bacterium]
MKKIFLVVSIILCASIAFSAEKALKIGYIDLQKSLNESDQGKEAKAAFNKRVEELQKALDEKQSELKKLQDELEKQKGVLTPEARGEKEKAYQQKIKDAQRFAKDSQEELQQKDAELTKKIIKDLKDVIKKMGTDEEYTIILEKGDAFVLFAAEGVDITDKVIKAYNKTKK